ncbi:MAG: hypothetical protein GY869_29690, partial [Planctomycetes bacterium]|nr:hypothetical protein [Planctomycetota bacterium]
LPLDDDWTLRFGPVYRLAMAVNELFAQSDYQQPSGVLELEYIPKTPVWLNTRLELGRRNYSSSSVGYSDYTIVKLDTSTDIDLGSHLTLAAGINYEKEFHTTEADDADFFFFFVNLYCRLAH